MQFASSAGAETNAAATPPPAATRSLESVESAAHLLADYLVSGLVPEMMIDTRAELLQAFTRPVYPVSKPLTCPEGATGCATTASAVPKFVGIRAHQSRRVKAACDPLEDVVGGSTEDDVLRNGRTGTQPSVLHVPRTGGNTVYNRIASWLWFHRRSAGPGIPLPGRPFPRHPDLHNYAFTWAATAADATSGSPSSVASFSTVPMCPELFRQLD